MGASAKTVVGLAIAVTEPPPPVYPGHRSEVDQVPEGYVLLTAKAIAPAQTRWNPMVHETVRALARAEARSVDTVHGFAVWCGIAARL
ncbi:hypothetical protein [Nocardia sp. NPDC047648]|uniref:hypothetical protein n=1 Tax=Nocardia sp. NPDC047648 TaxID=3155625 RepID=UPI0033DD0447